MVFDWMKIEGMDSIETNRPNDIFIFMQCIVYTYNIHFIYTFSFVFIPRNSVHFQL